LSNSTTSWRSPAVSRLRAFARIMDHPPSSTLQSRLTRFGRELPGASGPDAILDLLLAHVRAACAPRQLTARWETANGTTVRSSAPPTTDPPDEQLPGIASPPES